MTDEQGAQTSAGEPAAVQLASPRFALHPGSVVRIDKRKFVVERRIRGHWWFLAEIDQEPYAATDAEIAQLTHEGRFETVWHPDGKHVVPNGKPLLTSEWDRCENLRKIDYVKTCLNHPDFCRSRRVLNPIIKSVAARRCEDTPSFTAVLEWIDRHVCNGSTLGLAALSSHHDRKGRRGKRTPEYQEQAIQIGIEFWLKRQTKAAAYASVEKTVRELDASGKVDKSRLNPRFIDSHGCLKPPSRRTFEYRCDAVDPNLSNAMRIGARFARQHSRTYTTTCLPKRPYEEVEVDHCTLDIHVALPRAKILARPDVVTFRCRATGLILGWNVGFEEPSYASFVKGLESAIYGPDVSRFTRINNVPNWFGRIENLFHDNAFHFIGNSIKEAALQLGMNLVRLQPREPWLKGAIERWFRTLNDGLIHHLPETTLENVYKRRDHENLGGIVLDLDQFEELLAKWVCDVYHAQPSRSLGVIRGLDDGTSPIEAWNKSVTSYAVDLLPSKDVFIALAGQVEERTIQRNGVTIDHITYESPALATLIGHPKHRRKPRGRSTKYRVVRDPRDLERIFVVDHYNQNRIEVPACPAHRDYSHGLTLTEHQIVIAQARARRDEKKLELTDLVDARDELNKIAAAARNNPKVKNVQRRLARWLEGDRVRAQKSSVETFTGEISDYLSLPSHVAADVSTAEPSAEERISSISTSATSYVPPTNAAVDPHEFDDLAELREQKDWK